MKLKRFIPLLISAAIFVPMLFVHSCANTTQAPTGGLKDTVEPYSWDEDTGNGFSFNWYDSGLLLGAINQAKTLFFTDRARWDRMVCRDMEKDVSWERSAAQYLELYRSLER